MTDFMDEFADFQATTTDTFVQHVPTKQSAYTDKVSWASETFKVFNPKTDEWSMVRAIPWPNYGFFAREASMHNNLGPSRTTLPCYLMRGSDCLCPLCRTAREFYDANDKPSGNLFNRKKRFIMIVIDRGAPNEGPQLWNIPADNYQTLYNLVVSNPQTGAIKSIDNVMSGYDIIFQKRNANGDKTSTLKTIEDLKLADAPTVLGDENQMRQWLGEVRRYDFIKIFNWVSPEKALVLAGLIEGASDEAPHDQPAQQPVQQQAQPAQMTATATPVQQQPVQQQPVQQQPVQQQQPVTVGANTPLPTSVAPSGFNVDSLREKLKSKGQ